MIAVHYTHRLPADYDVDAIRKRAHGRGAVWNDRAELYFKAFLLREAGRFGAIANSFSSLYLWQHEKAFRDWLVSGGYRIVTDWFGRADIGTFLALDAFRGPASEAHFLYRQDIAIPPDADLTAALNDEIERARQHAARPTIAAAVAALDPRSWTFTRILLSKDELISAEAGVAYQIAHLSQPLLASLPPGRGHQSTCPPTDIRTGDMHEAT
ncbi:MAG: DUF4865 family protein [Bradyrhizobiaceae bacterium]|nr:MAG: DUF4865 family protein [Bradyrhizobiaceae bacterium]